ncbi:hypothetical protein D1007_03064 [Hordeum vulgare]|nr:hypothetical protein D1007_03064 [Hordeum vulgare]
MYQHHCALAIDHDDLPCCGSKLFVRAWLLEAHAENEDMMHHVRLCIEGVPVHAWNDYVATFVNGRGCSLDYIEQRSLHREDTRFSTLWAWTANPSSIPKVKWLTLSARGHRRNGRRGLRHRVLVHLDLHEDHSKARDDDENPPPPDVYEHTWYDKYIDGTAPRRDRRGDLGREERRPDRRDDEGDRDGPCRCGAARQGEGWRDRVHQSLSRNLRDRQRQDEPVPLSSGVVAVQTRGRSPVRHASPHANRQRSRDNLAPPASSTSVQPSAPGSKRGVVAPSPSSAGARASLAICSPAALVRPLPSLTPERPPSFDGCEGCQVHHVQDTALSAPTNTDPLFRMMQQPLLTLPVAPLLV